MTRTIKHYNIYFFKLAYNYCVSFLGKNILLNVDNTWFMYRSERELLGIQNVF